MLTISVAWKEVICHCPQPWQAPLLAPRGCSLNSVHIVLWKPRLQLKFSVTFDDRATLQRIHLVSRGHAGTSTAKTDVASIEDSIGNLIMPP